jgi:prophage tail gpP-like protein
VPNPKEIAALTINGQKYEDWTSVMVEVRITEAFPIFQFDCSEFDESNRKASLSTVINNMKIKPGDVVDVTLAGQQIVRGYVTERHVAYDARNHAVRIIGVGKTFDLVTSSVWSQGGSYDNQSWEQMARAVIAPVGVELKVKGQIDATPYKQIQVQPGELIASTLERYARQRNILLGSTAKGELLAIGDHDASEDDKLIEGVNIERFAGVIKDDNVYKKIYAIGQKVSDDSSFGDQSNKLVGKAEGSSTRERTRVTVMDVSDDKHGAQQRADMEKLFTEGATVEHNVTVQGWLRGNGGLWEAGKYYWVRSPMALTDKLLGCKSIVYSQDNSNGTTTTLTMVLPVSMKGKPDFSGTSPTT